MGFQFNDRVVVNGRQGRFIEYTPIGSARVFLNERDDLIVDPESVSAENNTHVQQANKAMTKQEAIKLGSIRVREFATGHAEATFTNVSRAANFRYELTQREIEFKDRFSMAGKAITYRWKR